MLLLSKLIIFTTLFSQGTVAHTGHDLDEEIAERNAFYQHQSKRDLTHCSESLQRRGLESKQLYRRADLIEALRAERGLSSKRQLINRDLESVTNTSHKSTLNVTPTTSGVEEIIYGNSSCLLSPGGEIGPFYVEGEYIRKNISESQPGIPIIIDAQFIDISTCDPIENLMWDIWHCNATGVYGGVIGNGNGNSDDTTNLNNTFLRGLQASDTDGVAQFESIFPGHYSGRATHMHVVAHLNGSILDNGTYSGGSVAHIGQLFFDQDLITEINKLSPYAENTIAITTNYDDRVVATEVENDADPFFNYVLLGDSVEDGIFAWVTIGIDTTQDYAWSAASELTANGGVALSSSAGGETTGTGGIGGNGTMAGNGTMPRNSTAPGVASGSASGVSVSSTASSTALAITASSGAMKRAAIFCF